MGVRRQNQLARLAIGAILEQIESALDTARENTPVITGKTKASWVIRLYKVNGTYEDLKSVPSIDFDFSEVVTIQVYNPLSHTTKLNEKYGLISRIRNTVLLRKQLEV